jgi:hypothetical protein
MNNQNGGDVLRNRRDIALPVLSIPISIHLYSAFFKT